MWCALFWKSNRFNTCFAQEVPAPDWWVPTSFWDAPSVWLWEFCASQRQKLEGRCKRVIKKKINSSITMSMELHWNATCRFQLKRCCNSVNKCVYLCQFKAGFVQDMSSDMNACVENAPGEASVCPCLSWSQACSVAAVEPSFPGNCGLIKENPWNSSWSRFWITSSSGGVSTGGWRVKKRSKFSASRPHCWGGWRGMKYREGEGGQGRGGVGMDRGGWIAGVGQGEENKNRGSGGVNQGVRWHHLNMVSNTRKSADTQSESIAPFSDTRNIFNSNLHNKVSEVSNVLWRWTTVARSEEMAWFLD